MKTLLKILAIFPLGIFAQVAPGTGACLLDLNFGNVSSYLPPTCGSVNAAQWSVSDDSCTISTPNATISLGVDSVDITICNRVNPSGNMEADDRAYLRYTVDGVQTTWRVVNGNEFTAVTELCFQVRVRVGAVMSVQVTYVNNHNSENWRLQDGGIQLCYTTPVALPVELSDFTVGLNNYNADVLWKTATETNNSYFAVERSEDGINFTEIERVNGAGNSAVQIDYSVIDYNPIKGISYYRLIQVDYDGKFTISQIVPLNNTKGSAVELSIKIFPNPASLSSDIEVQLEGFGNKEVLCSLIDAYGVEIYSFVVLSEFHNTFVISSSALPLTPGVYFVRGSTDESLFSKKLIVQ